MAAADVVLATGSLIPAMIVHALIDIGSGTAGSLSLRDAGSPDVGAPEQVAVA